MKTIYRISDGSYEKQKIATKEQCLRNYLSVFDNPLIVICDNCTGRTIDMVQNFTHDKDCEILQTNLGNAGSFLKAIEITQSFPLDQIFYIVEDDYLHRGGASLIKEGLQFASYVTLFDYIDKYPPYNCEVSPIFRGEESHWRWTASTTMTFAAKGQTLKEDYAVWSSFCSGYHPNDHEAFIALGKKNRRLCVSIPGNSTHCDLTFYEKNKIEFPDNWVNQL